MECTLSGNFSESFVYRSHTHRNGRVNFGCIIPNCSTSKKQGFFKVAHTPSLQFSNGKVICAPTVKSKTLIF